MVEFFTTFSIIFGFIVGLYSHKVCCEEEEEERIIQQQKEEEEKLKQAQEKRIRELLLEQLENNKYNN